MTKEVEITSLTYGGRGLGRIDGKVVFVPVLRPRRQLKVTITKEKKSFAEGEIGDSAAVALTGQSQSARSSAFAAGARGKILEYSKNRSSGRSGY